jgi:S-adenosylmethionine-dependent methyltransferase
MSSDHSFDGITQKFAHNIYGTTKGKIRHALLCHYLSEHNMLNVDLSKKTVLDAGCGLGHMTREIIKTNANITAIDISAQSIAHAREATCGDVDWQVGSLQSIESRFDYIYCHAVLEWTQAPLDSLEHLLKCLNDNGRLSLSFFNAEAHRFGNLIYGNFAYTEQPERNAKTVRLNPQNPVSYQAVLNYLQALPNIQVIHHAGIRCIHDYMRDVSAQSRQYDEILEAEKKYGTQVPYVFLGKYCHLIVQKH